MFREFDQKGVRYQFIRASDPIHYSPILRKFPVFSLFNRDIAAPAPETSSHQTARTTTHPPQIRRPMGLSRIVSTGGGRSDTLLI